MSKHIESVRALIREYSGLKNLFTDNMQNIGQSINLWRNGNRQGYIDDIDAYVPRLNEASANAWINELKAIDEKVKTGTYTWQLQSTELRLLQKHIKTSLLQHTLFKYHISKEENMTDKQKIENLKHHIEILTKENEELKAKPETIKAINIENLVNDLKTARKNYTDLSHAVLEQKVQYEELIHELKAAIRNYKNEINKCINEIRR